MSESAFKALTSLAALSRKSAKGLPAHVDVVPRWSGVGFSFLGQRFVTPMGQMAELLEVPPSTKLPGVQPWVVGLSNVRGRLLPLFDLPRFFGGNGSGIKKNHRVLVIETENLYSGIIVDRAFGMQHFSADRFGEAEAEIKDEIKPFVKGAYRDSRGEEWCVFNLITLAEDPRFLNAALV
jgi:twitching motility protein PilI